MILKLTKDVRKQAKSVYKQTETLYGMFEKKSDKKDIKKSEKKSDKKSDKKSGGKAERKSDKKAGKKAVSAEFDTNEALMLADRIEEDLKALRGLINREKERAYIERMGGSLPRENGSRK